MRPNNFYTLLLKGLNLNGQNFEFIQPALLLKNTRQIWEFLNDIPQASSSFFDEYAKLECGLQFPADSLQNTIGSKASRAWSKYLKTLSTTPQNQLPNLFRQWAMVSFPSVANPGASQLSSVLLLKTGKTALQPYLEGKPVDFLLNFNDLTSLLSHSPPYNLKINLEQDFKEKNKPISIFVVDFLEDFFTNSNVKIKLATKHYLNTPATPGNWYNSATFNLAKNSKGNPPWPSTLDWNAFFGPGGSLYRQIDSLVFLDEISLTLHSDAIFNPRQQEVLGRYISGGFWPFHLKSDDDLVENTVQFSSTGTTLSLKTKAGNPVLFGQTFKRKLYKNAPQ